MQTELPITGFPSPAEDYLEKRLDLNDLLIVHPYATFLMRFAGDILVVDRAIEPIPGKVVVASINGEIKVTRLHSSSQGAIQVLGVVTYVIRKVR